MKSGNIKIVTEIMTYSKYGALSQMFVIDAISKLAEAVSKSDPRDYESSCVQGESWVGVAKEIKKKLDTYYG